MADITYYVAMPFLQDDAGSWWPARRRNARAPARRCGAPRCCRGRPAISARWPSAAAAIPWPANSAMRSCLRKVRPCAGRSERAVTEARVVLMEHDLGKRPASGLDLGVPVSCGRSGIGLVPALRLAHIHGAVGFLQRPAASECGPRIATPAEAPAVMLLSVEGEGQPVDVGFQRRPPWPAHRSR